MFSLDAPLQPAIDAFVNPENDENVHKSSLNTIVMQVHRKVPVESLIQSLGAHLTSTDDKVRNRATLLLAEVLTRLPEMPLTTSAVQLLMNFFSDRLADYPSAGSCLQALLALEANHAKKIPSAMTTVELVQKLVKALHVPQLGQAMRKQCYSLMQLALEQPAVVKLLNANDEHGLAFAQAFLNSMEGEKDPRNLLLCLKIARELMVSLAAVFEKYDTVILQQYFDIVSCYFPITFTPPPNDPYGITSEELILSLRKAFAASDLVARHVLPFLLEKLATTVVEAKVDSIQTLVFCCEAYSINVVLLHLHTTATALYHEVIKGEKKEVIEESLSAISKLSGMIARARAKSASGAAYAWNKFIVELTKRATDDLIGNAVDSLVSVSASQVLAALGKESGPAFHHVLEQSIPLMLSQFTESVGAASKTEAALARVLLLVNTIDQEIDQSGAAQPMRPHAHTVIDVLVSFLNSVAGQQENATLQAKSKRLAIEALCHLVTYPPSPIIETSQVQSLLQLFTNFLLYDSSKEVRDECLTSLQAISTIPRKVVVQQYAASVMNMCLTKIMDVLTLPASDASIQQVLASSARTHGAFFQDVLATITELCQQPSIFQATVVRLVNLCVLSDRVVFDTSPRVGGIIDAVAKIVEINAEEKESMQFCVVQSEDASISPIVLRLLAAVANTASEAVQTNSLVDQTILSACTRVFCTVMQSVAPELQQLLANESITVFLQTQAEPSVAIHPASLQLVPLFSAVIKSANRNVVLPQVSLVINRLLELAQSGATAVAAANVSGNAYSSQQLDTICRDAALSSAKSLASIINKMSDGDEFDALIQLLLEKKLSQIIVDEQEELATRIAALQIYVWIAKALVIRGHKTHAPTCLRFLCGFLTTTSLTLSPVIQMEVAKSFKLLVDEYPDVLNRKCGASIMFLHRQRTFDIVVPALLQFISDQRTAPERVHSTTAALVAFSHVIASSPKAMYVPHLGSIFPLMVQAINTDNRELGSSAVPTFRALLFESVENVKPFLKEVFPGLLKQAQQGPGALVRRDALECLAKLATIPYELIHPYKDAVLKHLSTSLDDRKRFVRHAAVRVRNQWSVL